MTRPRLIAGLVGLAGCGRLNFGVQAHDDGGPRDTGASGDAAPGAAPAVVTAVVLGGEGTAAPASGVAQFGHLGVCP